MNGNQSGSGNLLDTTDCLEAVGVFKGWKNFFFVIMLLCIILLQASFWLVDLGMVPITPGKSGVQQPGSANISEPNISSSNITGDKEIEVPKTNESATPPITIEPNKPAEPNQDSNSTSGPVMLSAQTNVPVPNEPAEESSSEKGFLFGINFELISWIIRFVNAVFILVSILYCLTILFSLKVSMLGRLGGINHITRAFFLSLIMLILILPWQIVFDNTVIGAIFTSGELVKWQSEKTGDMMYIILYYLRFCGYMVLAFLLLIMCQIRSGRWAKAILRRLEII